MNPIRSSADLPARPECDDFMPRFHGFEELAKTQGSEVQGAALQRALGAHYGTSTHYVPWTDEDALPGRLHALLLAFDKNSGHILEHGEPLVTLIPPANTQHFGTIDFTVTKKKSG
jgi:hypothetical protein